MVKISVLKGVVPTKIFQQYQVNRSRLPFQNAMVYVPKHEIRSIMRRAHATGELTPQLLEKTLIMLIEKRSFARMQVVLRCWEEDLSLNLTPIHMQMALNLAAQTGHWKAALEWWGMLASSKQTQFLPETYTTVIKTMSQGGMWTEALSLFEQISTDGTNAASPAAQHAILNTLRKNGPWEESMKLVCRLYPGIFETRPATRSNPVNSLAREVNLGSIGTMSSGIGSVENTDTDVNENPHLLTEILHVLHYGLVKSRESGIEVNQSKNSNNVAKTPSTLSRRIWRLALKIYSDPLVKHRTTALQNACVEILSRSSKWQHAFDFLSKNLQNHYQSTKSESHHRVLTPETLKVLLPCLKGHTDRLSAVLEVATRHNVAVPNEFLESLFVSLLKRGNLQQNAKDSTGEVIECFMRLKNIAFDSTTAVFGYHSLCSALCDALLNCGNPKVAYAVARYLKESLGEIISSHTEGLSKIGSEHTLHVVEGRIAVVDSSVAVSLCKDRIGKFFDAIFIPYSVTRQQARFLGHSPSKYGDPLRQNAMTFIKSAQKTDLEDKLVHVSFLSQLRANLQLSGEQSHVSPRVSRRHQLAHSTSQEKNYLPVTPEVFSPQKDCPQTKNLVKIESKHENNALVNVLEKVSPGETIKDRNTRLYAQHIFAVALMLQRLNVDSKVYVIAQSGSVVSHFERFCEQESAHQKNPVPIPISVSTHSDIEAYFCKMSEKVTAFALESDGNRGKDTRTMQTGMIALNI